MAAGGPEDVALRKGDIDDGAQWLPVTDGGDDACVTCNPSLQIDTGVP